MGCRQALSEDNVSSNLNERSERDRWSTIVTNVDDDWWRDDEESEWEPIGRTTVIKTGMTSKDLIDDWTIDRSIDDEEGRTMNDEGEEDRIITSRQERTTIVVRRTNNHWAFIVESSIRSPYVPHSPSIDSSFNRSIDSTRLILPILLLPILHHPDECAVVPPRQRDR